MTPSGDIKFLLPAIVGLLSLAVASCSDDNSSAVENTMNQNTIPIACDTAAISPEKLTKHLASSKQLLGSVEEITVLSNGYALRFPKVGTTVAQLAQFVSDDRACCPFLEHSIVSKAGPGALWLELRGPDKAQPLIVSELLSSVPKSVVAASGLVD